MDPHILVLHSARNKFSPESSVVSLHLKYLSDLTITQPDAMMGRLLEVVTDFRHINCLLQDSHSRYSNPYLHVCNSTDFTKQRSSKLLYPRHMLRTCHCARVYLRLAETGDLTTELQGFDMHTPRPDSFSSLPKWIPQLCTETTPLTQSRSSTVQCHIGSA